MPYGMIFYGDSSAIALFEEVLNIFFGIDIVINFLTPYYEDNGELQFSSSQIALNYCKGFFFIDFVSSIPFSIITGGNSGGANKLLRIMKIPRLIKMIKLTKILKIEDMIRGTSFSIYYRINMAFLRMLGLGLCTCLLSHLSACLWCVLGRSDSNIPHTWIWRRNLQDAPPEEIYMSAVYFCIVVLTTIGYGDITAFTNEEIIFSIFWMLFGVAFYSFTIGIISSFFQSKMNKETLLTNRVNKIQELCQRMKIKPELQEKMIDSMTYSSDKISYQWLDQDMDIFGDLSVDTKYQFLVTMHFNLIRECPFFNNAYDPNFVVRVVPLMKPILY